MSIKGEFTFEKLFDPLSKNIEWVDSFEEGQYLSNSIFLGICTGGIGHGLYALGRYFYNRLFGKTKKIEQSRTSIKSTLDENQRIKISKEPDIEGSNTRNTYILKNRLTDLKLKGITIGFDYFGRVCNIDPVAILMRTQDGRLCFEVQNESKMPEEIAVNGQVVKQFSKIPLDDEKANTITFNGKQILFFGKKPPIN